MINLLRSPAYGAGDSSAPFRHTEEHTAPSPSQKSKDVANDFGRQAHMSADNGDNATPRLGDFGSLWDILGQSSAVASATTAPAENRQDSDSSGSTPRPRSPQPSPPITILKRPLSKPVNPEPVNKSSPRTHPRSIPGAGTPKPRKNRRAAGVESGSASTHNAQSGTTIETTSSDSTAESDGNVSVFDPPLSKKGGVSSGPSTQLARNELCDSPPSSFDELDGALTSDTIKKSPDNGVIRIQSNAYKSADERRVGLLSKLLQSFPDYTEIVSQVGSSADASSKNPSSRPIHVFIDISNVSFP